MALLAEEAAAPAPAGGSRCFSSGGSPGAAEASRKRPAEGAPGGYKEAKNAYRKQKAAHTDLLSRGSKTETDRQAIEASDQRLQASKERYFANRRATKAATTERSEAQDDGETQALTLEVREVPMGPPGLPGAQLGAGIEPELAVGHPLQAHFAGLAEAAVDPDPQPSRAQGTGQYIVKKEGKTQIVVCDERHNRAGLQMAPVLAIKKGEFRNRKVAGISSKLSVQQLTSWCQQSCISSYCVAAVQGGGSEAIIFDTPKRRLKDPPQSYAGTVSDKIVLSQLWKMIDEAETFRTVEIVRDESRTYSREDVMEAIRPYVNLNRAEFEAELIALRTQKDSEHFTEEHAFILANEVRMKSLRAAMVELEIAKSFLTSVDDETVLPLEKFVGLEAFF